MNKLRTVVRHYSMPEDIARLIDEWSVHTSRAKSEFIREAVRQYIRYLKGEYDTRKKA